MRVDIGASRGVTTDGTTPPADAQRYIPLQGRHIGIGEEVPVKINQVGGGGNTVRVMACRTGYRLATRLGRIDMRLMIRKTGAGKAILVTSEAEGVVERAVAGQGLRFIPVPEKMRVCCAVCSMTVAAVDDQIRCRCDQALHRIA